MQTPFHSSPDAPAIPREPAAKPSPPAASTALQPDASRPDALHPDGPRNNAPIELGGPLGPEPTRYGDWERKGRCIDF